MCKYCDIPPPLTKYLQRICHIWIQLLHLCIHRNHHSSHSIRYHIGHNYMLKCNSIIVMVIEIHFNLYAKYSSIY